MSLKNMNNVQRAKLLAVLLPEELPAFLEAMKDYCDQITADPDTVQTSFDNNPNPILSARDWINMAKETRTSIDRYGVRLTKATLFADQLFDGFLALYTSHCIACYAKTLPDQNPFRKAATLLFYID
ncbi:hypothetical protein [Paraflavitalea pollutisoli]|uniref:hypothetical protein n=1 Tax=Paraflavitalea pollutisoli TaxID=3034143 RepID=UPI0023EBF9A4|nr:hypothetical protein [Paraflavitalea sp. H1-2-19X]